MVRAEIRPYRGAPALYVNGKYTEPFMLFTNDPASQFPGTEELVMREQKLASDSGVHAFTFFQFLDSSDGPDANEANRAWMRSMIELDPDCLLMPRVLVPYDRLRTNTPESENERFTDGKHTEGENYIRADFISEVWQEQAFELLRRYIRMVRADPVLSEHVIGYHFSGGETGEWFQRRYWEGVLNISDANSRGFRKWLEKKYGRPFPDAVVPADLPGISAAFQKEAFLHEQRFVDYLDCFSDQVVSMLERASRVVKEETDGNSLFCTFYGYHFEIPGAYSGHNSLHRLLHCPDVDILCSPVSYQKRNECGQGAYMSEIGSVLEHGKLWLDESDYRMPATGIHPDIVRYVGSLDAAHEVILRECGKLALHGAGTWWMDLANYGWWDSEAEWRYIAEGRRCYDSMREAAKPAIADVVYLVDEKSMSLIGNSWQLALDLLGNTRDEAYFTGLSYDLRLLEDFLDGNLDGAKLYVFVNPFRLLREGRGEAVAERLRQNRAAALWMFGFTPDDDRAALRAMTGFAFDIADKTEDAVFADGQSWPRVPVTPTCSPADGDPLGTYSDGSAAFARTEAAGYRSYFFGGTRVYGSLLRTVARDAGLPLYTDAGDDFNRIGSLALLHTATEGEKHLHFDGAHSVLEVRSGVVTPGGEVTLLAHAGQTYLFILK